MQRSPVSIWFRLAGFAAALFCVTATAWAAAGVGDQNHPLKRWLGQYGLSLIAVEAAVVVAATVLGMMIPEHDSKTGEPSGNRPEAESPEGNGTDSRSSAI